MRLILFNFGYQTVEESNVLKKHYLNYEQLNDKNEILKAFFVDNKINGILWNKIFRRDVLRNIKMAEGKNNEDYMIMPEILSKTEKVIIISDIFYNYFIRKTSIMNTPFSKKKMDRLYAANYVIDYCKDNLEEYEVYSRIKACFICMYTYEELIFSKEKNKKQYKKIIKQEFDNNFNSIFKQREFLQEPKLKEIYIYLYKYIPAMASFLHRIIKR